MSNFEIGFEFVENEVAFVDRLQVGSDEAFETLIHLYQAPIYNGAYQILGNASEAPDAVQETFMKIFKGIKTFRGESGLKTWIYRIAISESLNRQRWWKRWRHHVPVSIDDTAPNGARLVEITDSGPSPESACAQMEMEGEVQKALNGLSFEHRVVAVLRDIEGLSYEEIAETLGLSLGTVKSRLWRARSEMKTNLESVLNSQSRQPQQRGLHSRRG
ncbi:MAG: sigma-70 family RNA polymerase sigma factor [Acidobacteria bacterium]|nr:sigma-70 family RNA polymerase sigma factor [Acidobacteriota bacterium]